MITRKLSMFTDAAIDRQIVEIVGSVNGLTPAQIKALPALTPVIVNVACTDLPTAIALLNQIRTALIANGICI